MSDAAATALVKFGFTKRAVTATTSSLGSGRVSRKTAARRIARSTCLGSMARH